MPLSAQQTQELVDTLRRQFLYQTPTAALKPGSSTEIDYLVVAIKPDAYETMFNLIQSAGGWEMPREDKLRLMKMHEGQIKDADGKYQLEDFNAGDLQTIYADTEGFEELAALRAAAKAELESRMATPAKPSHLSLVKGEN